MAADASGDAHGPLAQFEIKALVPIRIGDLDLSYTNSALFMTIGVAIGLGLDYWLDTQPWFMIVFFFLGAAAGMLNVYRTVTGIGHAVGYEKLDKAPKPGAGRDENGK